MLYVARLDRPKQHRGAVLHLHESVLAPPAGLALHRLEEAAARRLH